MPSPTTVKTTFYAFQLKLFFLYLQSTDSNAGSKTGTTAECNELTNDETAKTSVSQRKNLLKSVECCELAIMTCVQVIFHNIITLMFKKVNLGYQFDEKKFFKKHNLLDIC